MDGCAMSHVTASTMRTVLGMKVIALTDVRRDGLDYILHVKLVCSLSYSA